MAAAQEDTRLVLAISADIASLRRAMQQAGMVTKQTTDAMNDNFRKVGPTADRAAQQIGQSMERAGRQAQQVTRNIGFQLNDIAQGLLSGTSPFTIMAQQTSQITQALDGLDRGTSKIGALVGAFGSMLNIQTLVTAAIIYGTGALVQYFTEAEEGAEKTEDVWKRHSEAIAGLKDAYGKAAEGLREYAAITPEAARFDSRIIQDEMKKLADQGRQDILKMGVVVEFDDEAAVQKLKELRAERDRLFGEDIEAGRKWMDEQKAIYQTTAGAIGGGLVRLTSEFEGLGDGVQELLRQLGKGEISLTEFDKALALEGLKAANPETAQLVKNLRELIAEAVNAERALKANNVAFLNFDESLKLANALMPQVVEHFKAWGIIGDGLVNTFGIDLPAAIGKALEMAGNLANIGQGIPMPSMTGIGPQVTSGAGVFNPSQTQIEQAEARVEEAKREAERAQREVERATRENARKAAEAAKKASDELAEALANQASVSVDLATGLLGKSETTNAAAINSFLKRGGVDLDAATTAWCAAFVNSALAQVGVKGSGSQVATSFLGWGTGVKPGDIRRGDVLVEPRGRREGQTGGHVGFATGQTRFIDGIQQIEMLSGNASNKVQTDWVRASEVVARRASEGFAVPANALKNLTEETKRATEAQEALAREHERFAEQVTQVAQTAVSGFVNDLRNGVSAGDAFRNMLDRVIDGMINMAIESMFAKNALGGLFGGLFGGGQAGIAFGGGVGLYHGGGDVRSTAPMRRVSPLAFAGAPRLHNGLMPDEFPAILQKGEVVIPRTARRSAPTAQQINTSLGDINIDMSQSGTVAANSDAARAFGVNVQKIVQAEIVKESRPGGLLRRVPS